MTVDHFPYTAFGQRAHELIYLDAIAKDLHRREAANTIGGRQFLFTLGIDFSDLEFAVIFSGEFIEDRHEHFAGSAPVGPEIDQDGRGFGGFDDFVCKGVRCYSVNERVVTHFGYPKTVFIFK